MTNLITVRCEKCGHEQTILATGNNRWGDGNRNAKRKRRLSKREIIVALGFLEFSNIGIPISSEDIKLAFNSANRPYLARKGPRLWERLDVTTALSSMVGLKMFDMAKIPTKYLRHDTQEWTVMVTPKYLITSRAYLDWVLAHDGELPNKDKLLEWGVLKNG